MNKDWTDRLRTKLEDHASSPPEGLWESLSSELGIAGFQDIPVEPVPPRRIAWLRIASIAAMLILVVGAGLWLIAPSGDTTSEPPTLAIQQISSPVVDSLVVGETRSTASLLPGDGSSATKQPTQERLLALAEPQVEVTSPKGGKQSPAVPPIQDHDVIATTDVETDLPKDSDTPEVEQEEHIIVIPQTRLEADAPQDVLALDMGELPHAQELSRWSASMLTRGQFPTPRNTSSSGESLPMLGRLSAMNGELRQFTSSREVSTESARILSFTDDPRYTFKHRVPLRMGLSVGYALDQRFSLQTGLVYSFLRSDYSVNNSFLSISGQQELHYVGIPLGVNYRLLDLGRLSLYSSVGTMVEKCLYGYMRSRSQVEGDVRRPDYSPEERSFQWSARAGLGLEYRVKDGLSFFVEPQVSYYFDNGSLIKNYYKEHLFSIDFQLGFRWTLRTSPW